LKIELGPQPVWVANRAIEAFRENFIHHFRFLQKCYFDPMFHVKSPL